MKWNGREDEDWKSLILNPITGFEKYKKKKKNQEELVRPPLISFTSKISLAP